MIMLWARVPTIGHPKLKPAWMLLVPTNPPTIAYLLAVRAPLGP